MGFGDRFNVSIPERVWGGLEPPYRARVFASAMVRYAVSIPERVWGGLERRLPFGFVSLNLFQSLRGFGVGWSLIRCQESCQVISFNP